MHTQRKSLVVVISLFAFLTTSAYGALNALPDEMHWSYSTPPGVSADGTSQSIQTCDPALETCDEMHW
jgi:hypothetical protein